MHVLLVEDDPDLADGVARGLRQEHLVVDHVATVADALERTLVTTYDIVCLDLGLPDGDGVDLCRRLQSAGDGDAPFVRPRRVLMLTARDAVEDRVAGLDAGADDYLTKPFTIAELAARIRALSRRSDHRTTSISIDDLHIDVATHCAERGGVDLDLTGREFAVMRYLAMHEGEVVSAEELLDHCWDDHADPFTTSVRVILSRIRKKLGDPPLLDTVRGVGYRLGGR